jgi:hypothetical protein
VSKKASTAKSIATPPAAGASTSTQTSSASTSQPKSGCVCVYKKGEECRRCFMKDHFSEDQQQSSDTVQIDSFICGFCHEIVAHTTKNHLDRSCSLCKISYKCLGLLRRHMTAEHPPVSCVAATLRSRAPFSWKKFFGARGISSNLVLICLNCSMTFGTLKNKYEHHVKRVCPCNIPFRCLFQFTSHVRIYGCQLLESDAPLVVKCESCGVLFGTPNELQAHRSELIECDECGLDFNCASFTIHECKEEEPKQLQELPTTSSGATTRRSDVSCRFCLLECASASELQAHQLVSTCPRCDHTTQPCWIMLDAHLSICRFDCQHQQIEHARETSAI